jgi:subtilisin family serine protease
MKLKKSIGVASVGLSLLFAGSVFAETYMVVGKGKSGLPKNIESMISDRGGELLMTIPEIGVAVVESDRNDFMQSFANERSILGAVPNFNIKMPQVELEPLTDNPPNSGNDDIFFDFQWGHDAVNAPEAWDGGVTGAGVRVAVLDTGTLGTHPDLAPNFNAALSTSFLAAPLPDNWHFHGSHTAGTIAAADNGIGSIGVAPDAEIVGVQVCGGSGCPGYAILGGIVYAANIGADLINMSLGGFDLLGNKGYMKFCTKDLELPAKQCARDYPNYLHTEVLIFKRAFQYANMMGVTTVVSAGNSAADGDHNVAFGTHYPTLRFSFADYPGTIGVSATAPVGWCLDPENADFNHLTEYSNYGRTIIDFSAPGGEIWGFSFPGEFDQCMLPLSGHPAFVFDLVFSTTNTGWGWAAGTSMAAPHVTGVAALIISENGGPMSPAALMSALRSRAEDAGQPGEDPVHGSGAVRSGY